MPKKKRVLLLIETSRAYGRDIIAGISRYVSEFGCWEIDIEDRGLLEHLPAWVKSWKGDGVITRTATAEQMNVIANLNVPYVEMLGDNEKILSDVHTDEIAIGRLACEHLLQCGLHHFAFFSFINAWWSRLRCDAFVRALSLSKHTCHVYPGMQTSSPLAYSVWNKKHDTPVKQWLLSLPHPIGIFATNDLHALHILHACRDLGIAIPEKIAILGTSNDAVLCNLQTPSLSSIDLNAQKIGYTAAELLAAKMKRKNSRIKIPIVIPPMGVVVRKTTDVVAFDDDLDTVQAIQFIRRNALHGIKVDDVVNEVGLSYTTLLRRVKKVLGHTPEDEIIRVRIERAKQLLRETDLSIATIGRKVGVQYPEHFSRLFRSVEKISPLEYRKQFSLSVQD